jgi:hypothetical protein
VARGDDDRFPSKVLALHLLLAGKASPSSLVSARVLVLEERREVA